jgi:hypothetical protein
MADFGDYAVALKYRDVMNALVDTRVQLYHPGYRYGVVESIDGTNRQVIVEIVGEPGSEVVVKYNAVIPSYVGQYIRIAGPTAAPFVDSVIDGTSISQGAMLFQDLEQLPDPDAVQDIIAQMNNGFLTFKGTKSGVTAITVRESDGQVTIPGLVLPAPIPQDNSGRVVAEVYSSSIATTRVQNTEAIVSPITFTADPARKYRYRASSMWVGSVSAGTFFTRVKYASGSSVSVANTTVWISQWQNINIFGNSLEVDIPLPRGISGQITAGTSLAAINTSQGVMDRSTSVAMPYWIQIIDEGN